MAVNIAEIRFLIRNMGERIQAPPSLLSIPDKPTGNGTPHIEVNGDKYEYVVTERGFEFSRQITTNLDELLYWVFDSIAFSMAVEYELNHRLPGADSRRVIFFKQLEILNSLSPEWASLTQKNINQTLNNSPYNDVLS